MTQKTETNLLRSCPWLREEMYQVDGRYWPYEYNKETGRNDIVLYGMWTTDEDAPMGVRNMMRPIPVTDLIARGHDVVKPKVPRRWFA